MKKMFILMLSVILLSSCYIGWTYQGKFHYDAYIVIPNKVVEIQDNLYCVSEGCIFNLKDNLFVNVDFMDNNLYVNDLQYSDNKVLISSNNGIYLCNVDFEVSEIIDINVKSFLMVDNVIYYSKPFVNDDSFCSYDLLTKKEKLISTRFYNAEYKIGDKTIYSNSEGYLSLEYPLHNIVSNGVTYYDKAISIKYKNEFLSISLHNNKIEVVYKMETFEIANCNTMAFFDKLYINGAKLYFSVFDLMKKDDCLSPMCICHVGKSRIVSFDFEKEELKLEHELNEGSYLISIDGNGVCYYYDGYIYQNGNEICEVNKVEPYGEYELYGSKNQVSSGRRSIYRAMFLMHKNSIYVDFANFSYLLEDKYYA